MLCYSAMLGASTIPLMQECQFIAPLFRAMAHDEKEYGPDVDEFRPERFLGKNPEHDTHSTAFGFGRR